MFKALQSGALTLVLINTDNLPDIATRFQGHPDTDEMLAELHENYLPQHDRQGRRTNFGFYTLLHGELTGMSLLSVDSWEDLQGSTGADVFRHMRGQGVTPGSKPHLFYLAFELLGLHRVATGCLVSNVASQRSIEKTPGFVFEGVSRESGRNERGEFEDERLYSILRREWAALYDPAQIRVLE